MTKQAKVNDDASARSGDSLKSLRRLIGALACVALPIGATPAPTRAQEPPAAQAPDAEAFSVEQLDALLAPIALYSDALLTQVLMASTCPLEVVEAARWLEDPANESLTGDALTQALAEQPWDPAVKSLVPFPQVLAMMNSKLDWMQQLGHAMSVQESAVIDSIQRLRQQARTAGQLQNTEQQVIRADGPAILIEPAEPGVVHVPFYDPTFVYGAWPYPSVPPVHLPPPGYDFGSALSGGVAFGAGVATVAGLWGWARPNWGGHRVTVDLNRYNTINVNRSPIGDPNWRPSGHANHPVGLPPNIIGRPTVSVPGGGVRPLGGARPGYNPPMGEGGGFNHPGREPVPGNRPPSDRPATVPRPAPARPTPGGRAPA